MKMGALKPSVLRHQGYAGATLKTVHAEIIFGSPSANCQGQGICRVISGTETTSCSCKKTPIRVFASTHSSELCFLFPKATLSEDITALYFHQKVMIIREVFFISMHLASELGLTTCRVKPGEYTIRDLEDVFEIRMELGD